MCQRKSPSRWWKRDTGQQTIYKSPFPFFGGSVQVLQYLTMIYITLATVFCIEYTDTFFMNIHAVSWLLDYVQDQYFFRIYSILAKQFLQLWLRILFIYSILAMYVQGHQYPGYLFYFGFTVSQPRVFLEFTVSWLSSFCIILATYFVYYLQYTG